MNTPTISKTNYYPALDGMRGLAILLVVVYHNFGFINYFFFGWLGVDLFFVLSGFLITSILIETKDKQGYLKNFFGRRILRIFPIYYITLVTLLIILPALTTLPTDISYYQENQFWLWTYLENWLYIFKPDNHSRALHHFWSLAVEEQFYLLWPFVILLFKTPRRLLILLIAVLISILIIRFWLWAHEFKNLAYYNLYTFSRIDGLCLGSMVALLHKYHKNFLDKYSPVIITTIAIVNFGFFFYNKLHGFSFPYLAIVGYTTFAVLFAMLVHEGVKGNNKIINKIFSLAPLRFFGRVSYGFYIYHWPIHLCLGPLIFPYIQNELGKNEALIATAILTTTIGFLLSVLSFYTIERYFLQLKKYFTFNHANA